MKVFFHRMNVKNKLVEVEGDLLITNGDLRFYTNQEFECLLNGGEFKGNALFMKPTQVSIHRPCIIVDGFYRIDDKTYGNDSWSFYFQPQAQEF